MTGQRIEDLEGVETEHLLGLGTGQPLVKIRCTSAGTILLGQVSPAAARRIANGLMEAAARAEYELDLTLGARTQGMGDPAMLAMLLVMVRHGEAARRVVEDLRDRGPDAD